ncbi:hypothetical protein [Luteimonas sp. FCS-9]|uniref:hypothetical protein n=1 Tax=Luteimonas sp. FCS-9 TaxID=1547516 RepID=UPI0012E05030|nr:hypothetical protein [Luteimonas sp. FCS-9]
MRFERSLEATNRELAWRCRVFGVDPRHLDRCDALPRRTLEQVHALMLLSVAQVGRAMRDQGAEATLAGIARVAARVEIVQTYLPMPARRD